MGTATRREKIKDAKEWQEAAEKSLENAIFQLKNAWDILDQDDIRGPGPRLEDAWGQLARLRDEIRAIRWPIY